MSRVETLESAPNRALAFLRAIGTSRAIRAAMFARGYSADDHREGWNYLHACAGFVEEPEASKEDPTVRAAIEELDAWGGRSVGRAPARAPRRARELAGAEGFAQGR